MKFYLVTWRDESAPEGIAHDFFKRKRDARKCAADVRRDIIEERRMVADEYPELSDVDRDRYINLGRCDEVETQAVEIPEHLTPKDKIFFALKYQVVS